MNKRELFWLILRSVATACEISESEIIGSCRSQVACDARCIIVNLCRRYGLTTDDLLLLTGRKHRNSICSILYRYWERRRQSYFFRELDDEVERVLNALFSEK